LNGYLPTPASSLRRPEFGRPLFDENKTHGKCPESSSDHATQPYENKFQLATIKEGLL